MRISCFAFQLSLTLAAEGYNFPEASIEEASAASIAQFPFWEKTDTPSVNVDGEWQASGAQNPERVSAFLSYLQEQWDSSLERALKAL